MDAPLRRLTPWVLLTLTAVVWFEDWLPLEGLQKTFGEDGLLRFVLGIVCIYTMFLVIERQRMEKRFTEVLGQFKQFYDARAKAKAGADASGKNLEAIRILVAALASAEAEVRESAESNLKRLTGNDFGSDPKAWEAWLEATGNTGETSPTEPQE
jgi:hypothetical protein